MNFKFEVPSCMQNKVGCFVDLSDSAIYDESGGIPTTEDLEAVIDYNLTENCPKWMMQYPEHAGLLTAISKDLFIGIYGLVIFYLAVLVCILGVTILLKPTFRGGSRHRGGSRYSNTSTSDDWCDDSGGSSGGGGSCGGD